MKVRNAWLLPLFAAALAVPGAVRAQEDDECPCPGMIGVVWERVDDDEGVRVLEVRRGSPAAQAGLNEGDVVVRINGRDAGDTFNDLPEELEAGDTVRISVRRGGQDRELSVVAARRPTRAQTRIGIMRSGPGEGPTIFIGGDSLPLQALTMRIDSLQTRLLELNDGEIRLHMDSLMTLLADSANVFIQRMPNVELRLNGEHMEALEGLEGALAELDTEAFEIESEMFDAENEAFHLEMAERPFFMELGRRSAAGAELAEINEGLRRYFDNVQSGALVIDVSPNTPAARAGLEAGDVIVRAGGREVNDPEDVRRALMGEEDGSVALEVVRQGRRRELSVEWDRAERVIRREIAPVRARVRGPRPPEPPRAPPPPPSH
ncbi:PDZ domain-containing protein [Longimicrobium sp.]|uniref:PDZ domain-containing protein n=1 Tax=Longimicrobium sp. TaxID=2029185 RepID=UPI003B3A03F0